jgi:hypothetical protein
MWSDITAVEVAARIEKLLPGHTAYAAARSADTRRRMREILARSVTSRLRSVADLAPEVAALLADPLVDHAVERGVHVERRRLGDDFTRSSNLELMPIVLGSLEDAQEDVLAVSLPRCRRIHRGALRAFVLRERQGLDDVSFAGGDELFMGTSSPRLVVLHHEGWVFDLRC